MNLIYNGIDLASLGTFRVMSRNTQREPVEAPQRERVTYRMRLDFFEQTFKDNFEVLQQFFTALKSQQLTLLWNDGSSQFENRTVTVMSDDLPEDVMSRGGNYWQSVTFSFFYYNHDVVSNCLSATCLGLDLGAVEEWREGVSETRYDDLRDVRRRIDGTVTARGRYQANTKADLNTRRAAMLALKDQMMAALIANASGSLQFGSFNKTVRITSFVAEVDQPNNAITWNLSVIFTRYPNESDYALLEYQLTPRENLTEGIKFYVLSGKIGAPTEAAARARLAQLEAAVQPSGTVTLNVQTSAHDVGSESGGAGDGIKFIELTFSMEFRDPSSLSCTYQRTGDNTPSIDLGTIDKFRDSYQTSRFDEFRDPRKRTAGNIVIGGRWYVPDSLSDAGKTAALIARKVQLDAELVNGSSGRLMYTTVFNERVRIMNFSAEINRLRNCIEWNMTADFTRYPNEADYAILDVRISNRLSKPENIAHLSISGKISGPSESAARTRLNLLKGAIVPAGYANVMDESTVLQVGSESSGAGDGVVFVELNFTLEYRDTSSVSCTYQRTGVNTAILDLGTIDKFSDRYSTTLFDEMRNQRRRAAGVVTIGGRWYVSDALSDADRRTALTSRLAQMQSELKQGASGLLKYGSVFTQTVRVLDFNPAINRFSNCIEWSLTGSYTAFPNESDYATCEFKLATRQNLKDGTIFKSLAGEIWAPTPEAAQSKLARLRTALIPSGYVMVRDDVSESRVDVESDLQGGTNKGEGPTFIRLTVDEEWQSVAAGNLLTWNLRVVTDDDVKSGFVRTAYAGFVQAAAANQPTAFAAALAQARALGDGKLSFQLRSSVAENEKLFQTQGAQVFVTVEFSYEYQSKGSRIYLEVTSDLSVDNFGQAVETVSGYVAAPDLATAQTSYVTNVRNVASNQGALILSERTPTKSYQRLDSAEASLSTLDDRFSFTLQLLRSKDTAATAINYTMDTESNIQSLEVVTLVEGQIFASTETVARAFLDTFLTSQTLPGKRTQSSRTPEYKQGPRIGGADPATVFIGLKFKDVYVSLFSGVTGILESEVTEDIQYSGHRNIEKGIPDGDSVIQRVGIVAGRRTINCRCLSTTATAAQAWIRTIRLALLASTGTAVQAYEEPPHIVTRYTFLPQIVGVVNGADANVKAYEVNAAFGEILPNYGFNA